jgi:VWFA-related protein
MSRIYPVIAAVLGFLSVPSLFTQSTVQQVQKQPKKTVIRTTTREVVLDLVVRDKHHHAIVDLRPEEVEIYEDGVRQEVKGFRSVRGAEQLQTERKVSAANHPQPAPDAQAPTALNSLRQLNFVSVVLADIAPLNLEFARRAMQEFITSDTLPNTYVTVYRVNPTLSLVEPYTSDKDKMAKAVERAAKGVNVQNALTGPATVASSAVATMQADAENILAAPSTGQATAQAVQNELANPLVTISRDPLFAANAAAEDVSVTLGNAILAQAALVKGLRFSTEYQGMTIMDSLRELVRSEEKLPGRKVILYLADGLQLPPNRREVVNDVISYANRSGVSFYTVDTRGLNVEDPMMEGLAAQKRTAAESSVHVSDPRTAIFEDDDVQLTAVASKQLAMRELAESTGGFAVTNTNEIAAPMQRMMEDIRTHYELAYSPTSTVYDGHFRKIEVKVNRQKVSVQTRKGYYAVPDIGGEPLQPYEMLALNAMNAEASAQGFPYEFAAMKFRPLQQAVEYEVTFEIPLSALKPVIDEKKGTAHFQAGLVAFIHDNSGNVVKKISRELARDVPVSSLGQSGTNRILYAEPAVLGPGHYSIDAAVSEEPSGRTSVKRTALFVEEGKKLSLSSLGLVRRFEPLSGPRNPVNPFDLENGRITPSLTSAVEKGVPVSLYFVVYPANAGAAEAPNVTLELLKDGKPIARKPLTLASKDADGSFPMLVQLAPEAGECDVVVTARQGTDVAQSSLSLRVE